MCEMTSIGEMSPAMMQMPFLPCRIPLHTWVTTKECSEAEESRQATQDEGRS